MMYNLPHAQARKWAERYGLRYIKGDGIYSADMLNEKYRADVYAWYHNARSLRRSGVFALPPDRYFVFGAYSYCFLAGYPV